MKLSEQPVCQRVGGLATGGDSGVRQTSRARAATDDVETSVIIVPSQADRCRSTNDPNNAADSGTLGRLPMMPGWDGRHTYGVGCCSVLYRLGVFFRMFTFADLGNDIYAAILYRV